jgi:hypothetical protein
MPSLNFSWRICNTYVFLPACVFSAEPGYNAIEYEAAVNSWVRRVRILNADSGIKIYSSIFNTVSDVEIGITPKPRRGGRCVYV